jgi:hypothetical protein
MYSCHSISIHADRTDSLAQELFEDFKVFAFHRESKFTINIIEYYLRQSIILSIIDNKA